jgi:4-amino-4-deoxy-L-arabinose transferase-like glycosyltransferase
MKRFSNNSAKFYAIVVALLLLFRAFINGAISLMDKTETRYAEIARIMAETNNWITLYYDYNIPFWGKPPLSTWFTALSFEIFGVNEFSARLPSLLFTILLIFLVGKYAKRKELPFFLPAFILLTTFELYLHAGIVSTDTALAFCVALVFLSFWESTQNPAGKIWKYMIFVGFGLGLLAKGPIIFILTLPPIFLWSFIFKEFKNSLKSFPWLLGLALMLLISLPWYYLAEKNTPGFIDYFIVGEHFKRFLDSGWQGDKYGFPKEQVFGIIWAFLLLFALPWILLVLTRIWTNRHEIFKNKWVTFLLLWMLWTPLFFTFSSSLIHPYIMPVMVPVALLVTHWWKTFKNPKALIKIGLIIPMLILVIYIFGASTNKIEFYSNSDKYLIEHHLKGEMPIYYLRWESYSGKFYTKGKIKAINIDELQEKLLNNTSFLIIIPFRRIGDVPEKIMENLELLESHQKRGIYLPI